MNFWHMNSQTGSVYIMCLRVIQSIIILLRREVGRGGGGLKKRGVINVVPLKMVAY